MKTTAERNLKRNSKLVEGTRVVFRNKWNEMQKGTFTGIVEDEGPTTGCGIFICRPFDNEDVRCLFPMSCRITVLTEEEFQSRPWVK